MHCRNTKYVRKTMGCHDDYIIAVEYLFAPYDVHPFFYR